MDQDAAVFANTGTVLVNVRIGEDMYKRRGGRKYFESEIELQKFMLKNRIIDTSTFMSNYAKRLILQMLLPNSIMGWIFRHFARTR